MTPDELRAIRERNEKRRVYAESLVRVENGWTYRYASAPIEDVCSDIDALLAEVERLGEPVTVTVTCAKHGQIETTCECLRNLWPPC